MIRPLLLVGGIAFGALCAIAAPGLSHKARTALATLPGLAWLESKPTSADSRPTPTAHEHAEDSEAIPLTPEKIAAAGIGIAEAREGVLVRRLSVPGTIIPSSDRIARVAVNILGTVAELRKRLGERVEQGEVVAVIESREVADAKREYLAARLTHDLQQTLAARAKNLLDIKAIAENDYLRRRNDFEDARVKRDVARQKLAALGLTEPQIAGLPEQPIDSLPRQELRSPITGIIAERRADLGALVGREGLESELFVIVDLSEVWVELAVSSSDLAAVQEGQEVSISAGPGREQAKAKVIFIGPLLDKDTRSARVVASLDNLAFKWRLGVFVNGEISLERKRVDFLVPKSALQTIKGEPSVFVRTAEGFERRKVATGAADDRAIEIVSGLSPGENIAVTNSFLLKAELEKSAADHDD